MEVGDFFFVNTNRRWLGKAVSEFVKKHQPTWKFTCRKAPGGAKVWRIK
jgi:hypothetical protein